MASRLLLSLGLAHQVFAEFVLQLTRDSFDAHISTFANTLVEFYAPWCGHCKKLEPEYEAAAEELKRMKGIPLAKVDATVEKELAARYKTTGFPSLVWFEDGRYTIYDGARKADAIVEWVLDMTSAPIIVCSAPPEPDSDKPRVVLYADSQLKEYELAAKHNRKKATWYYVKGGSDAKILLTHKNEDPIEFEGFFNEEAIAKFLDLNAMPLFSALDGDSFERYMDSGKGLVWSLFDAPGMTVSQIDKEYRPVMLPVAKNIQSRYVVTYTDTEKFADPINNMLGVKEFPAIVVQIKAGDRRKYVHRGEMTSGAILRFIEDVEAGRVKPNLKSEALPDGNDGVVRIVVGDTLEAEVFREDKDVLFEVFAPWCGHCRKLQPEYKKLAEKIVNEELTDLVAVKKMDGSVNDSPVSSLYWDGFPAIFYVRSGEKEPIKFDGERSAKGLWKFIKKHATRADEIEKRMEKRKKKREGEL